MKELAYKDKNNEYIYGTYSELIEVLVSEEQLSIDNLYNAIFDSNTQKNSAKENNLLHKIDSYYENEQDNSLLQKVIELVDLNNNWGKKILAKVG